MLGNFKSLPQSLDTSESLYVGSPWVTLKRLKNCLSWHRDGSMPAVETLKNLPRVMTLPRLNHCDLCLYIM